MLKLSLVFLGTLIFVMVCDFIWLGVFFKNFYINQLAPIMRTEHGVFKPFLPAAVIVYLLMVSGMLLLALPLAQDSLGMGFLYGMLFGLITYGIFDFTNVTILKHWPWQLVVIDIGWGILLCGMTTTVSVLLNNVQLK